MEISGGLHHRGAGLQRLQDGAQGKTSVARWSASPCTAISPDHSFRPSSPTAWEPYFARFGASSKGKGYYSFDHAGVHMVALVNVMQFKPGGLASLGDEQMAWLKDDLSGRSASQPIVLFAHMPMWSIYEPWGWGSSDSDQILALVGRFGSVTVLNGHIHQIVSKV